MIDELEKLAKAAAANDAMYVRGISPQDLSRLISVCRKQHEALEFYAHKDYHFDAFSKDAAELHEDGGTKAAEALTAYNEFNGGKG